MNVGDLDKEKELKDLMKKGLLDIPHVDFEDKLMQKILLVDKGQTVVRKNIKASWLFLVVSIVLFPAGFIAMYNLLDFSFITQHGESVNSLVDVFVPGGVLIFSIVILLQIDNLLKLSFKSRVV